TAVGMLAIRPATEAAAPAFKKPRRLILLLSFITGFPFSYKARAGARSFFPWEQPYYIFPPPGAKPCLRKALVKLRCHTAAQCKATLRFVKFRQEKGPARLAAHQSFVYYAVFTPSGTLCR